MLSFVLHLAGFIVAMALVEYVTRVRILNALEDELRNIEARNRQQITNALARLKITSC